MDGVAVFDGALPVAELLRSVLEGSGIPAFVSRDTGAMQMAARGRVLVNPEDEERAREVIASADVG